MQQSQYKVIQTFQYQGLTVPEGSVYRIINRNDERVSMERTSVDPTEKTKAQSIYISPEQFKDKFTTV